MKRILSELLRLAVHFLSFCSLPYLLVISFNFTKGTVLNEDGILLIPFGIVCLIGLVALNVFLLFKGRKGCGTRKHLFWLGLGAAAALSLCLTFPLWECFFHCLSFFKGFNLGKQIYR